MTSGFFMKLDYILFYVFFHYFEFYVLCIIMCECLHVYAPWVCRSLKKSEEDTGYPRPGVTGGFEPSDGCWEPNPCLLPECPVLTARHLYSLILLFELGLEASLRWPQNISGWPWTSDLPLLPFCWASMVLETEPEALCTPGKHSANWATS